MPQRGEPVHCLFKDKTIRILESHFVADIGHWLIWSKAMNLACCFHHVKAAFFEKTLQISTGGKMHNTNTHKQEPYLWRSTSQDYYDMRIA